MKTRKMIAGLLTASMMLTMATGCARKAPAGKTTDKPVNEASGTAIFELPEGQSGYEDMTDEELKKAYSQFVFEVMKHCLENAGKKNVMISTDSILFALEMTAAGTDGETLDQMLQTMVPGASNQDAFLFAVNRMDDLQSDSLSIANSIWINESDAGQVYDNYLKYVQENFDAGITTLPFDGDAVAQINAWVEEKTNGRIKNMLDSLDPSTLMVLANAISFNGVWKTEFDEEHIYEGNFYIGDETLPATFLYGTESVFLKSQTATGFLKDYDDGKFAFMAILPKDNSVDINEFLANMTPEEYWAFWESQTSEEVSIVLPEFQSEYQVELGPYLAEMGMEDAFTPAANFSNMTNISVHIGKVLHKTFIDVNRYGTEAAAATVVTIEKYSADTKSKTVNCDRPFAYAIVDKDTGLPVFLGTVETV